MTLNGLSIHICRRMAASNIVDLNPGDGGGLTALRVLPTRRYTNLSVNRYNRWLKVTTNGSNPALLASFTCTVLLLAGEVQIVRLENS